MQLTMPKARNFNWNLKDTSTTYFNIQEKENGQLCVVLEHSLVRNVTSAMLHWWFLNFQNMKVTLHDVMGYEAQTVPVYLLWHPTDHINATLINSTNEAKVGDTIYIQEYMQYEKYEYKYPVNKKLKIFYCNSDGWAMGKKIPLIGEVMILRISFKDVIQNNQIIGAHYHYEIVMGASGNSAKSRFINKQLTKDLSQDFFKAWHLHNTIEVGTFENFLPELYAQKNNLQKIEYHNPNEKKLEEDIQTAYSLDLFNQRVEAYKANEDPYKIQAYTSPSFL